jgi:hypothetical protein
VRGRSRRPQLHEKGTRNGGSTRGLEQTAPQASHLTSWCMRIYAPYRTTLSIKSSASLLGEMLSSCPSSPRQNHDSTQYVLSASAL